MISDFRREYGRVEDISIDILMEKFDKIEFIDVAVLFGSRAEHTSDAMSDYDFAVIVDAAADVGWGKMSGIRNGIAKALNLPDCDFDVVDLEKAGQNLLSSIAEAYVVLKGDRNAVSRLLGKHKRTGKD